MNQLAAQAGSAWRLVTSGGRMPFVVCVECGARQVNDTNRLHRDRWRETAGGPRMFMCRDCAERET